MGIQQSLRILWQPFLCMLGKAGRHIIAMDMRGGEVSCFSGIIMNEVNLSLSHHGYFSFFSFARSHLVTWGSGWTELDWTGLYVIIGFPYTRLEESVISAL